MTTETENRFEKYATEVLTELNKVRERITRGLEVLSGPLDISVGATPHDVVYEEDKLKVLHYRPLADNVLPVPVLITYALINRQYMLDLQPDRSIIRKLLEGGVDVYMIDWGYPTHMDRYLTLDDYINGYMNNVVDFVRKKTGSPKVTMMGICQGGTFSAIYTALHQEKVKNLVTVVAPIDFDTQDGLLNVWAHHEDIDKLVDTFGIIPGDFMNMGFLLLNPFRLMFAKYVNFLENIDEKDFVSNFIRMEKWIFDSPGQAGEAFRQFLKDLYQKNLLVKGELKIGDRKVNLKDITVPLLNVFAEYDHLVPPACSRGLVDMVSSVDKKTASYPVGHIGIFVSSRSQKEVAPGIAEWLRSRSQREEASESDRRGAQKRAKK
jgi:polyhydroxyalkanoate synthase